MQRKRAVRMICAVFALMLALGTGAALADGGKLTYGGIIAWGYTVDGESTALLQINDGETPYPAYCLDKTVVVAKDSVYTRTNLTDAAHLPDGAADQIRAIVTNALPAVSLDALGALSGVKMISEADAVTAAQLAVWHAITGETYGKLHKRIEALYEYFCGLDPLPASSTPIGQIEIASAYEERADGIRATFRYGCTGKNADGSPIALQHAFSRDLEAAYGASVSESDDGGGHVVTVTGLPHDAAFTFTASGDQTVAYDAYFYEPVDGRESSQSLVGAYQGATKLSETVPYRFVPEEGFSLRILKIDSVTSLGLMGVVFEVSDTEDFSGTVYEIVTDAEGRASIAGLREGTYYVREKTPQPGYIPYEEVFGVEVNAYTREQVFKNTAYAGIELVKTDGEGGPVDGAAFSLYAGDAVDPNKLIAEKLKTNAAGLILIANLVPGTYTLVETEAPRGYRGNFNPVTVTVGPGEIGKVEMENIRIVRGKLNLVKRDAETQEQLAGAVLGVYADAACETELGRFTTAKTEAVPVEELLPGDYYVKELYAPEGYYLNEEVQKATLAEGETKEVTVYDNYIPHTAGNYGLLLVIGGSALAVCLALAFILRRKLFGRGA